LSNVSQEYWYVKSIQTIKEPPKEYSIIIKIKKPLDFNACYDAIDSNKSCEFYLIINFIS
jgi:hypothetical protein